MYNINLHLYSQMLSHEFSVIFIIIQRDQRSLNFAKVTDMKTYIFFSSLFLFLSPPDR